MCHNWHFIERSSKGEEVQSAPLQCGIRCDKYALSTDETVVQQSSFSRPLAVRVPREQFFLIGVFSKRQMAVKKRARDLREFNGMLDRAVQPFPGRLQGALPGVGGRRIHSSGSILLFTILESHSDPCEWQH